ncbi:MAG: PadR family transcriptional regulator [Actinomycetota bacterium]|nr:PadR family transcriptional regulator [Actinomycetota bacterium]
METRALERLASRDGASPAAHPARRPAAATPFDSPGGPARQRFLRPWTLLLLWLKPGHGADIKERLRALGMPEADYRFLRGLEAEGLLRSTWAPGEGIGPDRRVYRLTDEGLEQLERDAEALANVADALTTFIARRPTNRSE